MNIVDIHAHILPGLDDGAPDIKASMKMIRQAESQGVGTIIATTHYSHHFKNSAEDILTAYGSLNQFLKKRTNCTVRVLPGQEILYSEDTVEKIRDGTLMSMAGSRYYLVEFMPYESYSKILRAASSIAMLGYEMILAHAERYDCLREGDRVEELIHEGVKIQMNYGSIGKKWYEDTTRWCRRMLKEENVHFLGTDMHNTDSRKPELTPALHWMNKHLSEEYMQKICCENAEKIIKNQRIK